MDERTAREKIQLIINQPKQWLMGIDEAIENVVYGLLTRLPHTDPIEGQKTLGQAHVFLHDVPGVGKSDLINSVSAAIGAKSVLITGHPEMSVRDIKGGEIYNVALGLFLLRKGPILSNIVRFDEINRAHPKAQSVFLQAMEERIITLEKTDPKTGEIQELVLPLQPISDDPNDTQRFFIVLATANPIEQEGTYPLPEAQLDRFAFSYKIGLPPREEEKKIRFGNVVNKTIKQIITLPELLEISNHIEKSINLTESSSEYIQRIIENSRPKSASDDSPRTYASTELRKLIDEYVEQGLSPRSNFVFEAGGRTMAFRRSNPYTTQDDIRMTAHAVMNHRLKLNYRAIAEKITATDVIDEILKGTEVVL